MEKHHKYSMYYIITALVITIGILYAGSFDSFFNMNISSGEMYSSINVPEYKSGSIAAGIMETPQFDLQPGAYTFTAFTEDGGGTFELFSPDYTSANNTRGVVFASVQISADTGETVLSYVCDNVIRGARMRVVPSENTIYVRRITGDSDGLVYADPFAAAVVALTFFYFTFIQLKKRGLDDMLPYFACVFAALAATLPICRLSLPYAHDLTFHLARIEGVYESFRAGQFPVRMNTTFISGYGYADQIMYPPLFLYFPAFLRLLRVSPMVSYQIFIFTINLTTSGVSYYAYKRLFKRRDAAVLAAFAYTVCAFRLICVFTRASVGELLALIFLPLVLLGIYEIIYSENSRALPITGSTCLVIGFSGLINSHIVSIVVAAVLCVIFCAVNIRRLLRGDRFMALLRAASFVLLINAWVIAPLITMSSAEMNVFHSQYNSAEDAVYPFEMFTMFNRATGLSASLRTPYTAMPLTVGTILGLGALFFLFSRFVLHCEKTVNETDLLGGRMLIVGAVSLYFASTLFPWSIMSNIPFLGKVLVAVQFPWRYFSAASVTLCAVLSAAFIRYIPRDADKRLAVFICCGITTLFSAPYIDMYMQNPEQKAELRDKFSQFSFDYLGGREYLWRGTDLNALLERGAVVTSSGGDVNVTNYQRKHDNISLHFEGGTVLPSYVELPVYYYPGWRAEINGETAAVSKGENGVLRVYLVSGNDNSPIEKGILHVYYSPPIAYRVSEVVSLAVTVTFVIIVLQSKRRAT